MDPGLRREALVGALEHRHGQDGGDAADVSAGPQSPAAELAPLGIKVTIAEPGGLRTRWAGTSMRQSPTRLDNYEQTAGKHRAATRSVSGRRPGDPVRAAAAIAAAVDAGTPPLRLLLGFDALGGARARLERLRDEIDTHEAVTESVDLERV
ncbi:hypothetical protein [Streptomyces sp. NPDC003393]